MQIRPLAIAMTSGECAHKIEVDNLENGEVINHQLLLLKGHVRQLRSPPSPAFARPACTGKEITLRLTPYSEEQGHSTKASSSWEVQQISQISRKGQFILICDLGNHVPLMKSVQFILQAELSFCNIVQQLQLFYRAGEPTNTNYRIQPLYIVCGDQRTSEESLRKNCEKIDLNLRLVQCVYAEELRAAGFGRCTFSLNNVCQVFESSQTCEQVWDQNENTLWQNFAQELLNSPVWGGESKLKFAAFIGCTKYEGEAVAASRDFSYANIRRHLKGHAALGGGGLALFGTAYLYAWPQYCNEIQACFNNNKPVDLTSLPDDSNYRRTHGGVYGTTLGAVVHELGHTFDLGHTKDGIMGNGFDYINRVLTVDNLTECLPDRLIEPSVPKVDSPPTARPRFTQLKRTSNTFLEKYHEQKVTAPFYFTRQCVIILAHHKWFNGKFKTVGGEEEANAPLITYDALNNCITSMGGNHPLCLIEVRCVDNSLVKYWYELQSDRDYSAIYKFHLPKEAIEALKDNHYLFVLTRTGVITRLCER